MDSQKDRRHFFTLLDWPKLPEMNQKVSIGNEVKSDSERLLKIDNSHYIRSYIIGTIGPNI